MLTRSPHSRRMSRHEPRRCRRTEPEGRRSRRRARAVAGSRCAPRPADAKLRVFLFQLLCVLGQWERALNQLNVASEPRPGALAMAQIYGEAVRCEAIRDEVFDGKKSPMIFGEPEQWLALLIESLLVAGRGEPAALAASCGRRAFDEAPAVDRRHRRPAVRLDRRRRLAPRPGARSGHQRPLLLGAVLAADARSRIEAPEDLRDVVWMPAHLQFENGGESVALIPTRYPGSEASDDGLIALARKTVWEEIAAGHAPRPRPAHPRDRRRRRAAHGGAHDLADGATASRRRCPRRGPWLTSSLPQERLQPALLDRLTDDEPDKKQEPREARVMSQARGCAGGAARSRLAVQRHPARSGQRPGEARRYARRSVVNFGLPALSGRRPRRSTSPTSSARIRAGDPRLRAAHPAGDAARSGRCSRPATLDHHNVIGVEIHGQLWAQPVPLELLVRTEIDLETGKVADRRSRSPPRVA